MKKNANIIDEIIEYLEVERRMGTEWIPVRKDAASTRQQGSREEKTTSVAGPAAAKKVKPRTESGDGRLPVLEKSLTVVSESEIRRRSEALREIEEEVKKCIKCSLHESRTLTVFHGGSPAARLCFVGEGPGADEDVSGIPFVGRAGKLLTKIVTAMGLRREDVYICNTVKCRPPGNRTPTREEMETCRPYLEKQLEILNPDIIVALGLPAAQMLVKGISSISKNRGRLMEYRRTPVLLTYHPAYLLRNPPAKKLVWEDMKLVHKILSSGRFEKEVVKSDPGASLSLFEKKS